MPMTLFRRLVAGGASIVAQIHGSDDDFPRQKLRHLNAPVLTTYSFFKCFPVARCDRDIRKRSTLWRVDPFTAYLPLQLEKQSFPSLLK